MSAALGLTPVTAQAATRTVTTLNDSGPGSLREAMLISFSGDLISFAAGLSGTIPLASSLPSINADLTILSPNVQSVTIDGNSSNRIFQILSERTVAISGLILIKAGQYPGTAINNAGTLTLNHCTVGKSETFCILNSGSLTMNYCRIVDNSGGLFMGNQTIINHCTISDNAVSGSAVVANYGTLSITNTTFSRNTASGSSGGNGGAIFNGGRLRLSSSTICSNLCSGGNGGGLYTAGISVLIQNSIIAGNRAYGQGHDVFGAVTSQGYNLIGATNNSTGWSEADQTGTTNAPLNARLAPLQYNGGSNSAIFTHALLPGSPAIDGGRSFGVAADQRGEVRPFDIPAVVNAPGGDGSDVGAFEVGAIAVPGSNIAIVRIVTTLNNSGTGSLREALAASVSGDAIRFAPDLAGVINLTSSLPTIDGDLNIAAPNVEAITINGNNTNKIFVTAIFARAEVVAISGLSLVRAGGNAPIDNNGSFMTLNDCSVGGASTRFSLFNSGRMAINRCRFAGNFTVFYTLGEMTINDTTISENSVAGHGYIYNSGMLSITNSTISGNSSSGGDGGAIFTAGTLRVSSSTICSNRCLAGNGGGIHRAGGLVQLQNTIVAGNSASGTGRDIFGTVSSEGHNLIGIIDGSSGWLASDLSGTLAVPLDPLLGALQQNGGFRFTHALRSGSPALDAGQSPGLTTDQRGRLRPFDLLSIGNAPGGDGTDIGAFELNPPLLSIRRSARDVVLSWSTNDTGYILESTAALPSPPGAITWVTIVSPPAVVDSQYVVTNGPAVDNRFYRLKNP